MKEFKLEKVSHISATEEGIVLEIEDETITFDWGIIDKIAEVSEVHYHEEMMKDFRNLIIMSDQKKIN